MHIRVASSEARRQCNTACRHPRPRWNGFATRYTQPNRRLLTAATATQSDECAAVAPVEQRQQCATHCLQAAAPDLRQQRKDSKHACDVEKTYSHLGVHNALACSARNEAGCQPPCCCRDSAFVLVLHGREAINSMFHDNRSLTESNPCECWGTERKLGILARSCQRAPPRPATRHEKPAPAPRARSYYQVTTQQLIN
jgi:hypothetical protein